MVPGAEGYLVKIRTALLNHSVVSNAYSFSCYILECIVVTQKQPTDTQPNLDVFSYTKSFDQLVQNTQTLGIYLSQF